MHTTKSLQLSHYKARTHILVNSYTVELLNNGHITGSRPFVLHMEAVLLQKQRPIYESLAVERGVASIMSANYIY